MLGGTFRLILLKLQKSKNRKAEKQMQTDCQRNDGLFFVCKKHQNDISGVARKPVTETEIGRAELSPLEKTGKQDRQDRIEKL